MPQHGPKAVAVEVKSGPRRADLLRMEAFAARFRPGRPLIAGEGGVPLNEFLSAPPSGRDGDTPADADAARPAAGTIGGEDRRR